MKKIFPHTKNYKKIRNGLIFFMCLLVAYAFTHDMPTDANAPQADPAAPQTDVATIVSQADTTNTTAPQGSNTNPQPDTAAPKLDTDNPDEPAILDALFNHVEVPIFMYHGLINDTALQTEYFISADEFESDLQYLSENGYTTILMQDLIDYVETGKALPKKPVLLTFDDGYYNNYYYAFPLLREYNMKSVISIIGRFTDEYSIANANHLAYSHITWHQADVMLASGLVEIQNHSYDLHKAKDGRRGVLPKAGESDKDYLTFLSNDVGVLQKEITEKTGRTPTTFAYPFGFLNDTSEAAMKELGFKATLGCQEGMNHISRDPECLYSLKRYLRDTKSSAESILE